MKDQWITKKVCSGVIRWILKQISSGSNLLDKVKDLLVKDDISKISLDPAEMSPFQISKAVWDMLWVVVLGWRNNPRFALWHYCQTGWHVFVSMNGCPTINLRIITLLHQFFTTLPSRECSRETSCVKLWGISCLAWSLLFKLSVDLEWQQNQLTIPLLFISLSEVLGYRFCCFLIAFGLSFFSAK